MVRVDGSGGSNSLIQARGLGKNYSRGGEQIQVLQALNLDVEAGRIRCLHGPQRLRQNHAAEPAGRPGCALRRQHHRGRRRDHPHVPQPA